LDAFEGILSAPVFIRVDVDGFEMDVLQGAIGLLEKMKVRVLLETHSPALEESCNYFLKELGYDTKIVTNAWWRILVRDRRQIELNRWLVASNDDTVHQCG
jgi:methyltransferase FkbM-like protein